MVGIANTPERIDEYTPYRDRRQGSGGRGRLYGRFVVNEVKPFIDHEYRTQPGREATGVGGSSLGGLISLTLAWEFPSIFSLCAVISPSLWWRRGRLLRELARDPAWMRGCRFWLDMGTQEGGRGTGSASGVARTRRLVRLFDEAGLVPGRDYAYREVHGGQHTEASWAARFDQVLLFLFGTQMWHADSTAQPLLTVRGSYSREGQAMAAVDGVLETALYVDDLGRSRRFYQHLFEFEVLASDPRFCALSVSGKQVLLLFQKGMSDQPMPTPGGVIPPHDGNGHLHLAFAISAAQLAGWEARLREHGVEIESRITWPRGGHSLYFRDPDNHLVELATPGIWSIY
jgi:catechol 2,3-dioxygenase-like lactoylglutathione lyase family enzyme